MLVLLEAARLLNDHGPAAWHSSPQASLRPVVAGRPGPLVRLWKQAAGALRRAYARHRLIAALEHKSDHLLADIGLTRADIPAFAAAAVADASQSERAAAGASRDTQARASRSQPDGRWIARTA